MQTETYKNDETAELISSEKVDGTPVYASDGEKIGHIHHFMVGKRNGQVEYAVMTSGGFLGMGEEYRPVPWDALDYQVKQGGYVLGLEKERLTDAPFFERQGEPMWNPEYSARVNTFYGLPY